MLSADEPVLKSETGRAANTGANRDRRKSEAQKQAGAPIKVRSNFAALAAFLPGLSCDSQGRVKAKVHLPDSLTRYRVVALAASAGIRLRRIWDDYGLTAKRNNKALFSTRL